MEEKSSQFSISKQEDTGGKKQNPCGEDRPLSQLLDRYSGQMTNGKVLEVRIEKEEQQKREEKK